MDRGRQEDAREDIGRVMQDQTGSSLGEEKSINYNTLSVGETEIDERGGSRPGDVRRTNEQMCEKAPGLAFS